MKHIKCEITNCHSSGYKTKIASRGPLGVKQPSPFYIWCGGGVPCSGWTLGFNYESYTGTTQIIEGDWDETVSIALGVTHSGFGKQHHWKIWIDGRLVFNQTDNTTYSTRCIALELVRYPRPEVKVNFLEQLHKIDQRETRVQYYPKL